MRLLLFFLLVINQSWSRVWSVKGNNELLLCVDQQKELDWTDNTIWPATSIADYSCEPTVKGSELLCSCSTCNTIYDMKGILTKVDFSALDKSLSRIADCINKFYGKLEQSDGNLKLMKNDTWYRVETLMLSHETEDKDLKKATRIDEITKGIDIKKTNLTNLMDLGKVLHARKIKVNGTLVVESNPNLKNIDALLTLGFEKIEIRNNPKLKIQPKIFDKIVDYYLTYKLFSNGNEVAEDMDGFQFDYMNHKCNQTMIPEDCYYLEGDLILTQMKKEDLTNLTSIRYIVGGVVYSHDLYDNYRLKYLKNLLSINNSHQNEPALIIHDVTNILLEPMMKLFEIRCSWVSCIQMDQKILEMKENEKNWHGLVNIPNGDTLEVYPTEKNETNAYDYTMKMWICAIATVFQVAGLVFLFLTVCVLKWHQPKYARQKGQKALARCRLHDKRSNTAKSTALKNRSNKSTIVAI